MKILLLSDQEDRYLWDYCKPEELKSYDLMLSCGDLKPSYLSYLVTMGRAPLLYVHGNHDGIYAKKPPEGCQCIDDDLVTVQGLRILGLGGSFCYSGGPHQYSEREMNRRIQKLWWKLRRAGGVDLILTHAPPLGCGDAEDYAHRGFQTFLTLMDRYHPQYLVHGHVHLNYGASIPRLHTYGDTTVVNAYGKYVLELPENPAGGNVAK